MSRYRCYAACSFGLEAVVAAELRELGLEQVEARDARVYFSGSEAGIARANLCLAAADRVYIVLKEFEAETFEELFDGVCAIEWGDILPKSARFPVLADSVRSRLKSVPDLQRLGKKAVVEAMKRRYGLSFYKESGPAYCIYISLLADRATVSLNASGMGLNRRGYRIHNGPAPLRETLAAGLLQLTRWRSWPFYDIFCGSGTIAIEAARKARHMAPGLGRAFDMERWGEDWQLALEQERQRAQAMALPRAEAPIFASDIDAKAVEMARFHAGRAGVLEDIVFSVADATHFAPGEEPAVLVTNPPYAIRMGEAEEVRRLYRALGRALIPQGALRYYILSADEGFERHFGKRADKRRKVYNGNIQCCFYQYFK